MSIFGGFTKYPPPPDTERRGTHGCTCTPPMGKLRRHKRGCAPSPLFAENFEKIGKNDKNLLVGIAPNSKLLGGGAVEKHPFSHFYAKLGPKAHFYREKRKYFLKKTPSAPNFGRPAPKILPPWVGTVGRRSVKFEN